MTSQNEEQANDLAAISDIPSGLPAVERKRVPDGKDENEVIRLELEKHREEIADRQQDRELRKTYADRILKYLEWYSGVVAGFIILDGFEKIPFGIADTALSALVGSTAIAAIGLVGFIAKGLFSKS